MPVFIDQSKIRIDDDLIAKGAPPFPRTLDWWQQILPVWVDVTETADGHIAVEPNGQMADGRVVQLTPAAARRAVASLVHYFDNWGCADFSDALLNPPTAA